MRVRILLIVALTWAALGLAAARAEKRLAIVPPPPPDNKGSIAPAVVADPTEPQLKVELSSAGASYAVAGKAMGTAVEVSSGAKGTTLKVPTTGGYSGTALLNFKNSAPPMRFTLKLTRMPGADLSSLSLTSGTLTLQVGGVSTSTATKYFDARGREQATSTRAAYTVQAKRTDNGEVDIQIQRGPGAALGKALSVSWQGNYAYSKRGGARLLIEN